MFGAASENLKEEPLQSERPHRSILHQPSAAQRIAANSRNLAWSCLF
jgi:hypothetical protein